MLVLIFDFERVDLASDREEKRAKQGPKLSARRTHLAIRPSLFACCDFLYRASCNSVHLHPLPANDITGSRLGHGHKRVLRWSLSAFFRPMSRLITSGGLPLGSLYLYIHRIA